MGECECSICAESLDGGRHRPVKCPSCGFLCGRCCLQRYFTDCTSLDCPACRRGFDRRFLHAAVTQQFLRVECRRIRCDQLRQEQRAKMSLTLPLAARERLRRDLRSVARELNSADSSTSVADLLHTQQGLRMRLREQTAQVGGRCPCAGVVMNGVCLMCRRPQCAKCGRQRSAGHRCSQEDVLSFKAISETAKPCPECRVPIFKLEGCDTMFCTHCHLTYSYRSDTPRLGSQHNPERHGAMFSGKLFIPRDLSPSDLPCGGLQQAWLAELSADGRRVFRLVGDCLTARYEYPLNEGDFSALRVRHILGDMSEVQMVATMYRKERLYLRNTELRLLYDAVTESLIALLLNLVHQLPRRPPAELDSDLLEQAGRVKSLFNREVGLLERVHQSRLRDYIDEDWQLCT